MRRPSLRSTLRTGMYGLTLLLAGCFETCDKAAQSLGPAPVDVTVDRLVTDLSPGMGGYVLDLYFTETGSFTVTAMDPEGRPVPNAQNGILVDVNEEEEMLHVAIADEPDPDNATIRVTVKPLVAFASAAFGMGGNRISLRFVNPDRSEAAGSVIVGIHHDIASLALDPAGPVTLAIGQSQPVTLRALDAQGAPVPGAEHFLGIVSTNTLGDTDFDLVLDWNGPADGVLNGTVTGLHVDQGSATFSLDGDSRVAPVTLAVNVVTDPAPSGHVISVTSSDAIHVDVTWEFEAVIYDSHGNSVPGDEFVTATSSDPAVAAIEAKIDDVPNDGRVKFRVKGLSVGQTTITYHYPGGPNGTNTTDTTILTVNP